MKITSQHLAELAEDRSLIATKARPLRGAQSKHRVGAWQNCLNGGTLSEVVFRNFKPQDREAFRTLNEHWIEKYFRLEEKDRQSLGDPEGQILAKGGHILVAERDGQLVGCCALMATPEKDRLEVAKMTIAESERGQGVGRQLLEHVIRFARESSIRTLYLETNTKLESAVRLYEAVGFRHLPAEQIKPSPYARANVYMQMDLR